MVAVPSRMDKGAGDANPVQPCHNARGPWTGHDDSFS